MPRIPVPDLGKVAKKWSTRASAASPDYSDGVQSTAKDWQGAAIAGAANYKAGVTAAANAGRFEKGVARVGTAKWRSNALSKGPMRYAQGVSVGEQDYSAQMAPVLQTIGSIDLPPRQPTGSDGNIQRVALIAKGLRALKVGR
jgi:hypothetical protein